LIPHLTSANYNQCALYVCDGTKVEAISITYSGGFAINVTRATNVSTWSSSPVTAVIMIPAILWLKVVVTPTTITWYWSNNGYDFLQLYSSSSTAWLASVSYVGIYADAGGTNWPCGVSLVDWEEGTS
jgi:hypothetical protein